MWACRDKEQIISTQAIQPEDFGPQGTEPEAQARDHGPLWSWRCTINGQRYERHLPPGTTLLTALRDYCGLTGTKGACLEGECGSCTVLLDGEPVNSCLVLAAQVQDRQVTTIEGLASGETLHRLQEQFLATGAAQCGYCTPGMIMAAAALLRKNPAATLPQLYEALEGNICRCTGYTSIAQAIQATLGGERSP